MSELTLPMARFLAAIPLFAYVEPVELVDLLEWLRPVQLTAGQVLFREGTPGTCLWVLGPGVSLSVASSQGPGTRQIPVAELHGGDTVGEMALVDRGLRSATATVLVGGGAYALDADAFQVLRGGFRPAAFKVLRRLALELCARLRGTDDQIVGRGPVHLARPSVVPTAHPSPEDLDFFPAFSSLPAVVKVALAQKLGELSYSEVQPVFAEGDAGDAAYFLVEGHVSVGRNGRTLARMNAGELFGMVSVLDGGVRSASCVTEGRARLWRLSKTDFETLFRIGNRFAYHLVDVVVQQLVAHVRNANAMLSAGPLLEGVDTALIFPSVEMMPRRLDMALG